MASSSKSSIPSKSSKSSKSFFSHSQFYPRTENNFQLVPQLFKTNFDVILQILIGHPISYALTGFPEVPEAYVHQLWHTLKFRSNTRPPRFEATLANVDISFDQTFLRNALLLPLSDSRPGKTSFDAFTTKKLLCEDLVRLGYNASLPNLTNFTRGNLPPIYYSLFSILNKCLTSKPAIDRAAKGIHYTLQGILFDKHYDFSTSVWDEMIKIVRQRNDSMATAKKYLPFPRFFAMIVHEKLQQHPEIPKFPDEEIMTGEAVSAFKETMGSATAVPMVIPLSVLKYADQEAHSVREYMSANYPPTNQPEPAGSNRGGTQITPGEGSSRPRGNLKIRIKRKETEVVVPILDPEQVDSDDVRTESDSGNKAEKGDKFDDDDDNNDDDDLTGAVAALLSIQAASSAQSFHDDILDVDDPVNLTSASMETDPVTSLVPYSDDEPITPMEDTPIDDQSVDILFNAPTPVIQESQSAKATLLSPNPNYELRMKNANERNITREVVDPTKTVILQNYHIPTPPGEASTEDTFNTEELFANSEDDDADMSVEGGVENSESLSEAEIGSRKNVDPPHTESVSRVNTPAVRDHVLISGIEEAVVDRATQCTTPPSHSASSQKDVVSTSHGDSPHQLSVSHLESTGIELGGHSPRSPTSLNAQLSLDPFDDYPPVFQHAVGASVSDRGKQVVNTVNQPVQLVNPYDLTEQQLRDLLYNKLMSRQSTLNQTDVQLANILSSSSSSSRAAVCTKDDLSQLEERLMSRILHLEELACRPQTLSLKRKHDDPDSEGPPEGEKRLRVLGGPSVLIPSYQETESAGSSSQQQQPQDEDIIYDVEPQETESGYEDTDGIWKICKGD